MALFIFLVAFESLAEPRVLKCEKDCGTLDINDDFTFQARMAQGEDMWGANVTFIEDDIILSSAHILGFEPNKRKTLSCGAEAATKKIQIGIIIKKICMLWMEKIILRKKSSLQKY